MPPRKNKTRKQILNKKQLKEIESSLLKISVHIENYIYKNRPISLQDADFYIREVRSYKCQYRENPRIFQVTEKLLYQLNAVIQEGGGSTNSYNVQEIIQNSVAVFNSSPTYSLQEIEMAKDKDPLCIDIEKEHDNTDKISNRNEKEKAIKIDDRKVYYIDCSDEDINENNKISNAQTTSCSLIQNIERSLCQMEIKSVNENKPKQSILQQVRKISQHRNPKNVVENLPVIYESTNVASSRNKDFMYQNLTGSTEMNHEIIQNVVSKIVTFNDSRADKKTKDKIIRNKAKSKNLNRNTEDVRKKRSKTKQTKNILEQQLSNDTNAFINQTEDVYPRNDLKTNVLPKPMTYTQNNNMSVYNDKVVNDLSWIENIRYIREVAPNEIDPNLKYYDDSFWDSYDLPVNWNDQDFLF